MTPATSKTSEEILDVFHIRNLALLTAGLLIFVILWLIVTEGYKAPPTSVAKTFNAQYYGEILHCVEYSNGMISCIPQEDN